MKRLPTQLLLAALMLAVAAGFAAARPLAHDANTRADRVALRRENLAVKLINEATQHVRQRHPRCRTSFDPDARPTFTDARPSDALLSTLGVLRRPATDADHVDPRALLYDPFASNIYTQWIRVATATDGRQFVVFASQDRLRPKLPPRRCLALQNAELGRLLAGREAAVRRYALRLKRSLDRSEFPKGGFKPQEAIYFFTRSPSGGLGGGGGGVDVGYFRRHGMFMSSGTRDRSDVAGLLPDGVASVEMTFARSVSRGPHRDPKVYPRTIRVTVSVRDNVVSLEIARPAEDAFPTRMVWRRANGSVIRDVRGIGG